jgi:hypothetical protein
MGVSNLTEIRVHEQLALVTNIPRPLSSAPTSYWVVILVVNTVTEVYISTSVQYHSIAQMVPERSTKYA